MSVDGAYGDGRGSGGVQDPPTVDVARYIEAAILWAFMPLGSIVRALLGRRAGGQGVGELAGCVHVGIAVLLRIVQYGTGSRLRFGTARPNTILFGALLVSTGAYGPPAPLK